MKMVFMMILTFVAASYAQATNANDGRVYCEGRASKGIPGELNAAGDVIILNYKTSDKSGFYGIYGTKNAVGISLSFKLNNTFGVHVLTNKYGFDDSELYEVSDFEFVPKSAATLWQDVFKYSTTAGNIQLQPSVSQADPYNPDRPRAIAMTMLVQHDSKIFKARFDCIDNFKSVASGGDAGF